MKENLKKQKGITLIALVITIIVLLILAGVSIAMLTGDNGILTQATNTKVEQSHGSVREGIALAYNEYQIEINTASNKKLASITTVQIQGKEENALVNNYSSFLDFLVQKRYVTLDEADETIGIINVAALTGSSQSLGKGTETDVYKVEEENGMYVVNYYDEYNQKEEIWSIVNNDNDGDNSNYSVENINESDSIGLRDVQNNSYTTFTNAYISYNNEMIDISNCIYTENGMSMISCWEIRKKVGSGLVWGDNYKVTVVKDGKSYSGEVVIRWAE